MKKPTQIFLVLTTAAVICLTTSQSGAAQQPASSDSAVVEQGKFTLHKFEQAIGEETYEIRKQDDSVAVKMNFKFTDRATSVLLTASFRGAPDLTPQSFGNQGQNRAHGFDRRIVKY